MLDSRNAAAVFNAAAMAAGGGRGIGGWVFPGGEFVEYPMTDPVNGDISEEDEGQARQEQDLITRTNSSLRINTSFTNLNSGSRSRPINGNTVDTDDEDDPHSAASSAPSSAFDSESEAGEKVRRKKRSDDRGRSREVWNGGLSAVIGLQKRGLRGLMEGRRLRERGASVTREGQGGGIARMGLTSVSG